MVMQDVCYDELPNLEIPGRVARGRMRRDDRVRGGDGVCEEEWASKKGALRATGCRVASYVVDTLKRSSIILSAGWWCSGVVR